MTLDNSAIEVAKCKFYDFFGLQVLFKFGNFIYKSQFMTRAVIATIDAKNNQCKFIKITISLNSFANNHE